MSSGDLTSSSSHDALPCNPWQSLFLCMVGIFYCRSGLAADDLSVQIAKCRAWQQYRYHRYWMKWGPLGR
jgi:hypothetical protein